MDKLKEHDINLYVEPISNDAGTATGAALLYHYMLQEGKPRPTRKRTDNLFLGPEYNYSINDIREKIKKYPVDLQIADRKDVAELISDGEIVSIFQGRSENGPRALGNRSILFNPIIKNGKDIVNRVKGREYFRPFAGTIMKEHVHDWFDMKGMEESPSMMYAVDVKKEMAHMIPSVLHVDNTCRIQTVTEESNPYFYDLIKEFHKITDIPILFNTSFNLAGDPIVETIEDAMEVLRKSELNYIFLPEMNHLIHSA